MVELVPALTAWGGIRRPTMIVLSSSHGQGASDDVLSSHSPRDLDAAIAAASGGRLVALGNGGKGGQSSKTMLARARRLLRRRPDFFFVQLFANDAFVLGTAGNVTASLDAALRIAKDARTTMIVVTEPPTNTVASQATIAAINAASKTWCAANGVRCVDIFPELVAADGVSWKTNYNHDANHWTSRTCQRVGQYIWSQITGLVPDAPAYTAVCHDATNLLFTAIKTDGSGGASATNVREGLFLNHVFLNQNGFNVDLPYVFRSHYGSGTSPTVVAAYAQVAGVRGNVFSLTVTPAGAGVYNFTSGSNNRIDVTRFQGRRLRIAFLLGTSGFSTDNTDALLAGASDVPVSGFGFTGLLYHANGTQMDTTSVSDPIDTTGTVSAIYTTPKTAPLPLDIQAKFGRQGADGTRWMLDQPLSPVFLDINVPVGATALDLFGSVAFQAGAVSPVTVSLAEMAIYEIGPFDVPELPAVDPADQLRRVTGTYTVPDHDGLRNLVHECDATSGAFTITLASALTMAGHRHTFVKVDGSANAVTLDGAGGETINGAATQALSSQWSTLTLWSNGKQVYVV